MKDHVVQNFKSSVLMRSARVLPKADRRKMILVVVLQICLGFIDLLGVAAFGVLGALSVTGVQSLQPGNRVSSVLELLHLSNFTFQTQVAILAISAASILVLRTVLSIIITKRIFFFLSRRGAMISSNLISKLLSQSLIEVQSRPTQKTLYSVTVGVSAITLGVLGTAATIVSDVSLLFIMVIGLFIVDPTISLTTIIFFGTLGLTLYRLMSVKAHKLGAQIESLNIKSNEKIIEVLTSYRESLVRNRRHYYAQEIGRLRLGLADVLAEMQFMPNISKYVVESGIVIGAVLIAGAQFAIQDAKHAVATLTVFLAAGTRIAPAIIRLQQSAIQIKNAAGSASSTLELIEELRGVSTLDSAENDLDLVHSGFSAEVVLENVSFQYPNKEISALKNISIRIKNGDILAIVGPSGAGKTTFVDVLLGVLTPNSGNITISNCDPITSINSWPGAISYVPQDVMISNGTIRENVALGYPMEVVSEQFVWDALEIAQLADFVKSLPLGLDTPVGERGTRISGGQRQRLGIARAMVTKPKLLVLDEATSSLDGQTEADISDAIQNLKGMVTVVLIAHRLSTVRSASDVMYMEDGEIVARGSFDEVRSAVPDFDRQALLMGL